MFLINREMVLMTDKIKEIVKKSKERKNKELVKFIYKYTIISFD